MTFSEFTKRVDKEHRRFRRKQRITTIVMLGIMLFWITVFGFVLYLIGTHVLVPWLDKLDRAEAAPVASSVVVTIAPGDTLWHIAKAEYPDMDPRKAVYMIRQLNPEIDPGRLQIGQKIVVPEVISFP